MHEVYILQLESKYLLHQNPIIQAMIPDKKKKKDNKDKKSLGFKGNQLEESDSQDDDELLADLKQGGKSGKKQKPVAFDMKNILGYLNQGENLQTLSIGGIMQLQAFKLKDLIEEGKNEMELTRDSFIQKITHLAVSYFCYSTEIRFIL